MHSIEHNEEPQWCKNQEWSHVYILLIPTQDGAAAQLQKLRRQPDENLHAYLSKYDRIHKMATGTPVVRQYAKIIKLNFAASVDGHITAKMCKKVNSEEFDDQNLKDVFELEDKIMQHLST